MQKAIYTTVGIDELLSHVQALKGVGARFVQMHAERNVDDGTYRLVYTFINVHAAQEHIAQDGSYAIENLVVEGIDRYQEIPSISSYYPAVFPFENESTTYSVLPSPIYRSTLRAFSTRSRPLNP
ncbi:hypothetical protein DXA64_09345 [Collinsella sp. OF03-4AA]|nr:hypothetical protein DXA64_09345 [Collinsella sp. OF03-4AA]